MAPKDVAPAEADPRPGERMPYETFLAERGRMVEARQRVQQRTEQLVTGGAAGALVLSVTFLEKIAPTPSAGSRPLLLVAWALLLVSLLAVLIGGLVDRKAFDDYIKEFDASYSQERPFDAPKGAIRLARYLATLGVLTFVFGIGFLAWFGFVNTPFTS